MNKYYHQINLPEEKEEYDGFTQKQLQWLLENIDMMSQYKMQGNRLRKSVFSRERTLWIEYLEDFDSIVRAIAFDSIATAKDTFLSNHSTKQAVSISCRKEINKQIFWINIEKKPDWYFVSTMITHEYSEKSEKFVSLEYKDRMSSPKYFRCDGFKGLMVYLKDHNFLKINSVYE